MDDPTLLICRICRDIALTYLDHIGIVIADNHVFVRMLCVNSHYVPDACWTFHNRMKGTSQRVIHLAKPVDNFPES
jgi:hypothetical protein